MGVGDESPNPGFHLVRVTGKLEKQVDRVLAPVRLENIALEPVEHGPELRLRVINICLIEIEGHRQIRFYCAVQ